MDITNPSKKQAAHTKWKVPPSHQNVDLSQENGTTSKISKKKPVFSKSLPTNSISSGTDCEEMDDDIDEPSTISTTNITRLNQVDEPKKIINKLCTALNKSDFFEDDEDYIVEDEEDNHLYTKSSLGSFTIYKFKPKLSTKIKSLESYLYIPPFRVKKKEMRKAGYWKKWEERLARNVDFTAEDIEEDLISKIETVIEYFINFAHTEHSCTEESSSEVHHKVNMHEPYLPTPHDLRALQSLRIKVDSVGKKWTDVPTTYCSVVQAAHKQKFGRFSRREADKMKQNWEHFKKDYKFYDLRPLLGVRTFLLEGNAEKFTYTRLQYINTDQHLAFIKYLGRGLENRSIIQLYVHAVTCLFEHASGSHNANRPMSTRELHLMDHFINKYGLHSQLMEFLLHSKTKQQFTITFYRFYRFRRCPFNTGPWSSAEVLRLLDSLAHYSRQPAGMQRTALGGVYKNQINWNRVMERVQTRYPVHCGAMFHTVVKQALKTRYYTNANKDEDVQWTAKHELLLIKELCQTSEDSLTRVNFHKLTTYPEFAPFCDDFLKRMAKEAINSRVPVAKRRYFDDTLDYLDKEVIPVLSKKIEEHEEVFTTRYLSKAKELMEVFPDYLNKYVIKMFSSLPLHESTDTEISEALDDSTDSGPVVASRTSLIDSDAEGTGETIAQSDTDTPSNQRNGVGIEAATKRKRQCELDNHTSKKSKKRRRKKERVSHDDVTAPLVSTNDPVDVITLD